MATEDFDMVSDLNDGSAADDGTISASTGSVGTGGNDAVEINNQKPLGVEPQARKIEEKADTGDKPLSLRDQISSALKGDGDPTGDAALQDGGRKRDPVTGQFIEAPAVIEQVLDPAAAAPLAVAAPQGIDPEVFKSLPAETQVHLARTMDDLSTRQQSVARLEQLEQLVGPRRDAWALNGMTDAMAVNQLLALSDFAGRDTAGFIKYIAEQNGVDLEELVLGTEPVDPQYKALQDQIAELQGARTTETQQRAQAAHNNLVDNVITFASEKGQDGNLLRPHFGELADGVLPFISAVKQQNPTWPDTQVLQEAYDRACWGTPSVRSKMQAAADAVRDAERLRQGADKAAAARAASASVRSGAPSAPSAAPNDPNRGLRDTIKASIAAHS